MSKFKKNAVKVSAEYAKHGNKKVTNFMGGSSYELSPMDALRIVSASSIFGEPSFYKPSHDRHASSCRTDASHLLFADMYADSSTSTTDVFTDVVDAALEFDFKGTLEFAISLRMDFYMRLNPAVIFIRASVHEGRAAFNVANPGEMRAIGKKLILRPDDITNQFEYYMFINGTKKGLPSIVKRTWADRLSEFGAYHIAKYKSKSLVDLVRISHANSPVIDELMETGTVVVDESSTTWETLRSQGKTWKEIASTIRIPHMALLRNLRGIFLEVNDLDFAKEIAELLKAGVLNGKQFPFRYYTAKSAIENAGINHASVIIDALNECLDISVDNMPKLKGKTAVLSDNSGSAWGAFNSQYGSVTVGEISNLSGIITCLNSDEGELHVFGDRVKKIDITKRDGILNQLSNVNSVGKKQGMGTENGIWLFFENAIKNKIHYDNIFIYSDQQAGHGGLFGNEAERYKKFSYNKGGYGGQYIDVLALVSEYRRVVNSKVNVFSTQVAGYDNSAIPENIYRGAVLAGWTGKETTFARELINTWDSIENVTVQNEPKAKMVKTTI
jgi:hypothetical protein